MKGKKIGLFGGTFNPIHIGHLVAAEDVREKFSLSEVLFIPAYIPPHKSTEVAPARCRLDMVEMAIKGNSAFKVSDIELRRNEKSYTVDTLKYLSSELSHDFYFLIGSEAFMQIHTWKNPDELFVYTNFIVFERPGRKVGFSEFEDYLNELAARYRELSFSFHGRVNDTFCFEVYAHGMRKNIYLTDVINIEVSATMIRKRIKDGKSIRYLVPYSVEEYIKSNGLYR